MLLRMNSSLTGMDMERLIPKPLGSTIVSPPKSFVLPVGLPIGWGNGWGAPRPGADSTIWNTVLGPVLGWLLTAFAASMGAPFWFDLLNKVMVIRATVKPREKSPEEGSEDRKAGVAAGRARVTPVAAGVLVPGGPAIAPELAAHPEPHPIEDGCDVPVFAATRDEDLPPAEGGVA